MPAESQPKGEKSFRGIPVSAGVCRGKILVLGRARPAIAKLQLTEAALAEAAATKGKPTCIVAHTIKGKGVSFMENNPKFHGTAPTQDELKLALQELK